MRLTDIAERPGVFTFGTFDVAPVGNALLFGGFDPLPAREPWRTDGSRAGTRLLVDIPDPDFGGSMPRYFMKAGTKSLFFADDGTHGFELWSSDGTAGGTRLVRDDLWRTNGTAAGTAHLLRRPAFLDPQDLVVAGSRLYFANMDLETGTELWALRP